VKKIHCLIITDTLASRQFLKRGDLDAFNYNVPANGRRRTRTTRSSAGTTT